MLPGYGSPIRLFLSGVICIIWYLLSDMFVVKVSCIWTCVRFLPWEAFASFLYKFLVGALKTRNWTSRDWTTWHHIARVDIEEPDNAAPYRKGGHRGTWHCGTWAPYSKGGQRETWERGARSNRGVRAKWSRVVVYGYLITAFTVFIILYACCTLIVCCFYPD